MKEGLYMLEKIGTVLLIGAIDIFFLYGSCGVFVFVFERSMGVKKFRSKTNYQKKLGMPIWKRYLFREHKQYINKFEYYLYIVYLFSSIIWLGAMPILAILPQGDFYSVLHRIFLIALYIYSFPAMYAFIRLIRYSDNDLILGKEKKRKR